MRPPASRSSRGRQARLTLRNSYQNTTHHCAAPADCHDNDKLIVLWLELTPDQANMQGRPDLSSGEPTLALCAVCLCASVPCPCLWCNCIENSRRAAQYKHLVISHANFTPSNWKSQHGEMLGHKMVVKLCGICTHFSDDKVVTRVTVPIKKIISL